MLIRKYFILCSMLSFLVVLLLMNFGQKLKSMTRHREDFELSTKINNSPRIQDMTLPKPHERHTSKKCEDIKGASDFCTSQVTKNIPLLEKYGLNGPATTRRLPVIVTGADTSHYMESQGCIKSLDEKLRPEYPDFKLIYYDLGLRSHEREQLQKHCRCEVRYFPYALYPPHVGRLNSYAFKPIIISTVMQEYDTVWWMDASIRITDTSNITKALQNLDDNCVSAFVEDSGPNSVGSLVWRTSSIMFKFFNAAPSYYITFPEFMGGFVMLKRCGLTDFVVKLWTSCALVNECISPPDAKLYCPNIIKNVTAEDVGHCHRYDQSALNILVWRLIPEAIFRVFPDWVEPRGTNVKYFPDNK